MTKGHSKARLSKHGKLHRSQQRSRCGSTSLLNPSGSTAPSPTAHGVPTAHPAEGTEKRASPEAKRLHYHRFAKGAAISDGVIAPFVVQTTPEAGAAPLHTCLHVAANCSTGVKTPFVVQSTPKAGAAPLHTCLRRRGKLLHGSHRAFPRQDHTKSRSGSTAHVSSKARQIAPRESSRLSSSRPHRKPERLHCTHVFQGAANCSTGVIAPFVVKTTPEAGAAPLQSCLPWRGK